MVPFLVASLFNLTLEIVLLLFQLLVLLSHLASVVVQLLDLGGHLTLIVYHLLLLPLEVLCDLLDLMIQEHLVVLQSLMSVQDVHNLWVVITVVVPHLLEELLVGLDRPLLLLDAFALLLEYVQLLLLLLDLAFFLLIFDSQFFNTCLACLDCLHVGVQVASIGDQLLLELMVLDSQFLFSVLEAHLSLCELPLLLDECLLVLVHPSPLV